MGVGEKKETDKIIKLIEDGVELFAVKLALTDYGVCGYIQMDEGIESAFKENGIDFDEFTKRMNGKINRLIAELCQETDSIVKQLRLEGTLC